MPVADYLQGLAFALATYGAVALAALWLTPAPLRGAPRAVAVGLLATAGVVAVHLVPGALGVLSRWSVLAAAAVLLALALRFGRRPEAAVAPAAPRRPAGASWLIAAVAALACAACALAFLWLHAGEPIAGLDALTFHLPNVARWIQSGSLWQIDQFVADQAHGYYPHNGDLVLLSAVLPWRSDAFVRFVDVPFLALLGVGVYAIGRELRAPAPASVLAAAFVVALPIVVRPALESALPDTVLLAAFAGGVLFLLRGDPLLAGIGLGLAFGTKWYGVSSVAALLVVWAVARRPRPREALVLGGTVLLAGGFWLVRNWVEGGNPVMPVDVPVLFDAPPDPVRALAGGTVAQYLDDWGIVEAYLIPSWRFALSWGGPVLALAAAAGLLFARVRWLALAAIVLAAVYAVTPYTALGPPGRPVDAAVNVRYLMPALLLAAPLLAWLLGRLRGRLRIAAEAIVLVAIVRTLTKAYDVGAARVLVAAAVLAGVALLAWRRPRVPTAALAAGAAILAVGVAAAGAALQDAHHDGRYADTDPVVARLAQLPPGARVGLANRWSNRGLSPVLPSFGDRLEGEVEYLGPFVEGMLRRERSPQRFLARARRFDVLVVGRGAVPAPRAPEEAWLARAGWRLVAETDRLALYRRPGA